MQLLNLLLSLTVSAFVFATPEVKEQPGIRTMAIPAFNDEDTIRKHVVRFFEAMTALNFKAARTYAYTHEDCEKVFVMLENITKDPDVKKNPAPTIKEVKIDKDRATVIFVETSMPMQLEKTDSLWKIHMCGKK